MLKMLPPFKLKDFLIKKAKNAPFKILDAGRGNPNYMSLHLRKVYQIFESFAYFTQENEDNDFVFLTLEKSGLKEKFLEFTENHSDKLARHAFNIIKRAEMEIGESADDILFELCTNLIASQYPYPPRISPLTEKIVKSYLNKALFHNSVVLACFTQFITL